MIAKFIDGVGRSRVMNVPDARPEYLVPIPRNMIASFAATDLTPERSRMPCAVFRRVKHSQELLPEYRYVRTEDL